MTKQQKAIQVGKAINLLAELNPSEADVKTIFELMLLPRANGDNYRSAVAAAGLAIYNAAVSA